MSLFLIYNFCILIQKLKRKLWLPALYGAHFGLQIGKQKQNEMKKKVDPIIYSRERLKEKGRNMQPGPLVTVSRAYGCPAKIIAENLVKKLNKSGKPQWKWISKEILHASAKELGLPPGELQYFFKYHEQGVFDGMLSALAKFYVSDRKIYKVIEKVIYTIGYRGHSVIVGRGGAAICKDISQGLHIRLFAPIEWRIKKVMETHELSHDKTSQFIQDYDKKRKKFLEHFTKNPEAESLFDIEYNCASLTHEEIVTSILCLMKDKSMH